MKCKFCGCTEERACLYTIAGLVCPCYWVADNVCSAPPCVRVALKLERVKLREIPASEIRRLFRDVA